LRRLLRLSWAPVEALPLRLSKTRRVALRVSRAYRGPLDLRASRASVVSADPRASAARPGLRGQPVGALLQSKKAHRRLTLDSTAWLNL